MNTIKIYILLPTRVTESSWLTMYSASWPGTLRVERDSLKLTEIHVPPSPE